MSTTHNDALRLRPYGEIDTSFPDCGVRVLPGRLAAQTHPLNQGREVPLPNREHEPPVHSPMFDFNDKVIPDALEALSVFPANAKMSSPPGAQNK